MSENEETPATMGNEETVILKKLIADKAANLASAEIKKGRYGFDIIFRVKGIFHREKDYETLQVNQIPTWRLLGVAMSKLNGVTMYDIMKKAIEDDSKKLEKETKERAKDAIVKLKGTTKHNNNGAIKMKELITEVTHSCIKLLPPEEEPKKAKK